MSRKLIIEHLNAQSINNKSSEINKYVSENKIDILSLNETWLKHNNNTNLELLRNYHLLRNDRLTRGGGVAILINKQIKFNNINKKPQETMSLFL